MRSKGIFYFRLSNTSVFLINIGSDSILRLFLKLFPAFKIKFDFVQCPLKSVKILFEMNSYKTNGQLRNATNQSAKYFIFGILILISTELIITPAIKNFSSVLLFLNLTDLWSVEEIRYYKTKYTCFACFFNIVSKTNSWEL